MKKLLLPIAGVTLLASTLTAQVYQRCASYDYEQAQLAANPSLQATIDQNEQDYQDFLAAHPNGYNNRAIVTIPVVFHIVYANSTQNISTTRILQQVDVLNKDYRKQNTDANLVPAAWTGIAADCEIEFCLAKQDPSGNWTDGIDRVQTTVTQFSMNDDVKFTATGGANAWDRSRYLNVWVCNLGGGLLGYSTFPGGAANVDGCVLLYQAVGVTGAIAPYNKGRTATHEIGHWLSMRHIWGDDGGSCSGSDQVSDTPNQGSENYGCPTFPHTDACSTTSPGVMFMNFMDYTDDACMYMFTAGQKTRMWAALNGSRLSIQTSNACQPTGVSEITLKNVLSVYPSPSTGVFTMDFGVNPNFSDVDVQVSNMLGETVYAHHYDAINDDQVRLDLTGNKPGVYFLQVKTAHDRITRKIVIE